VKDIENWIALPPEVERKLLKVYLPFVPNKPLYSRSKKRYYPPGSPKWHEHIKEAHRVDCERKSKEQRQNKLQREADYHGTTVPKLNQRKRRTAQLTQFLNHVHNAYTQLLKPNKTFYRHRKKVNQDNLQFKRSSPGTGSDSTSDNTKEIESRPLKRIDTMELCIHPSISMMSRKKSRILLTGDDDHLEKEN
jgi:hypothetical protein